MTLVDGLIGYWNFEESNGSRDLVGDKPLSISGDYIYYGGYLETQVPGIINNGIHSIYRYDRQNYGVMSPHNLGCINVSNDFTISFWFKTNTETPYNMRGPTNIINNIGGSSINVLIDNNGIISFLSKDQNGNRVIQYTKDISSLLNDNEWHNLIFTRKKSSLASDIKLYIDEVLDNSPSIRINNNLSLSFNGGRLTLWAANGVGTDGVIYPSAGCVDSNIDELSIWGRELTSNEIIELYNNGVGWSPSIADTPVANYGSGSYPFPITVTLNADIGTIYYTLDGSTPDDTKTLYEAPIIINSNTTLKAISIEPGYIDSSILTNTYNKEKCATPIVSPASENILEDLTISITTSTEDATIYYTVDGEDPTINSLLYTAPFIISPKTTVKSFAIKEGCIDSDIKTEIYHLLVRINRLNINYTK